jgi:hypothetical protein
MIIHSLLALLLVQAVATPEQFFVGRTLSEGTVRVMMAGSHSVRVESSGRLDAAGALVLDLIVREEGKPARPQRWRLVRTGPNRFGGTISAARGPVTGEVRGNVLHLRYRSVEGPSVDQRITLHSDGRTAHNRMVYRRFGLVVGTVDENIHRIP